MEDENEFLKLPVDERCVHKLWKARVSGYEEAIKLFNQFDGDDPNWKKYNGVIKKFIVDTNAVAQEKGLEAALAYVENCEVAGKVTSDCVEGIVSKCVAAPKTKTKDLAKQIALMFVEIETYEKVIEELLKGLPHKNPKVVSGCIHIMTACLHAFGAKVIKVSPLLKAIVPLLDHKDKTVREEGKGLIVEAYCWVGDIMKQQLTGVKPVQMTEFEAAFEKSEKLKKGERLLRSQQTFAGGAADDEGEDGEEKDADKEDDDGDAADDPYELLDPVDILEKLPKNFYELVEEKKWQLRKEALDALHPLSQTPKLSPSGDYNELIRVLKKFISKDSNVMLVTLAAQCLAGIAKGLRSSFKNGANICLLTVLEKCKEKKPTVLAALVEALDALYPPLGIEGIQEDCLASLKHKTPHVVAETAKYLARCFARCPPELITNKKMVKGYVSALLDCISHADANVRESASESLGVLMKILGEPVMTKLMPDLEAIKMTKVKEYSEKTVLTGKMPKIANPEKPKTVNKPKPSTAGSTAPKKVVRPQKKPSVPAKKEATPIEDEDDDFGMDDEPPPPPRKTSSAPARRGALSSRGRGGVAARPSTAASAGQRKKSDDIDPNPPYINNNKKNQRFKDEQKLKVLKWHFSAPRAEFVDQLKEQMTDANFNRTLMIQMFHSDFKQHLKAIDMLTQYVDADLEGLVANLDLILKWVTLRFFETNPAVLLKTLDYLNVAFTTLADDSYSLHDIEAVSFIPYLINKVGDPKDQVRNGIRTMFKRLRQVYPVSKLCPFIIDGISSKNAKQRTECLEDVGSMIKDYGINVLQPSPANSMKLMAKQIADRDTKVRGAALNAISEAYFQAGEKQTYKMIGNIPDKDMSMLEERIKRAAKSRPPPGGPVAAMPPPVQEPPEPAAPSVATGLPRPGTNRNMTSGLRRYGHPAAPQIQAPTAPMATQNYGSSEFKLPQSKGSPGGRDRPASGAFTLDLDKIESGSMYGSIGGPQLVNHNLDDIFNDDPVKLPQTLAGQRQGGPMSPPLDSMTVPGSIGGQAPIPLTESSEAYEALDVILAQVFNKDASACILALSQLDEFIKDDEKVVLLGSRMDQLLTACYMQYRHVLNNKMRTDNAANNAKEVMRLFQYLTMVLMSTYHHAELTRSASVSALHDLFHVIISILLEPKMEELADGAQLLRALNVLTVKIIDRSDHTNITSAIIKLLSDAVANSSMNPKFAETVMKCMWKIIRLLPNWMNDEAAQALDIDVVLSDLHDFLKTYPPSYWKTQDSDTPLRTVKTVLHAMVKVRGDVILDHLTQINNPQNSELVAYLRKLVNNGVGKENANTASDDIMKNGNTTKSQIPSSVGSGDKIPRFTKSDHDALAEIFRKIGQKELTKQGLQELYNFKQQNPQADLEPFLVKSSEYFRNYIERGLKSIESETHHSTGGQRVLADSTYSHSAMDNNTTNSAASDGMAPHLLYLDRLKKLRAQAGLERGGSASSSSVTSSSSGIGTASSGSAYRISVVSENYSSRGYSNLTSSETETESTSSTLTAGSQSQANPPDVDAIRKRLERIKQSAIP